MRRARGAFAAALLAAVLAGCTPAASTPDETPAAPTPTPTEVRPAIIDEVTRIVVLGDSVTLGVNACPAEDRICGSASWATGNAEVDSLAVRAAAQNPAVEVQSLARDGARLSTALGNLDHVVGEHAQLAIVFLGANDACAPSLGEMTEPEQFRDELGQLLDALAADTDPEVLLVEVPDLENVWEQGHGNGRALRVWASTPACRSLLADAEDTGPAAEARRAAVSDRVEAFNTVIEDVCAARPRCTTDGGAVHDHPF
ncbi:SGNH/GDSL hydrolase family protein, partial [Schumannella luteola]